MMFCTRCGAKIEGNDKFCTGCGMKLYVEPEVEVKEEESAVTESVEEMKACCEYKILSCALDDLERELNTYAKEGWYVISCDPNGTGYVAVMEREV